MAARKLSPAQALRLAAEERHRLGAELHESLGQQVTGVAFLAKALELRFATSNDAAGVELAARFVERTNRLASQAAYLARRLQEPEIIEAAGLPEALRAWCVDVREAFGIECRIFANEPFALRNSRRATALFHFIRELLHEACAHCRSAPLIELHLEGKGAALIIRIHCAQATSPAFSMPVVLHTRAAQLGGKLRGSRTRAGAWTLRCAFPSQAASRSRGPKATA